MNDFLFLVPIAIFLGLIGLLAFIWSLKNSQYDDMDGAAERILFEEEDRPVRVRDADNGNVGSPQGGNGRSLESYRVPQR